MKMRMLSRTQLDSANVHQASILMILLKNVPSVTKAAHYATTAQIFASSANRAISEFTITNV